MTRILAAAVTLVAATSLAAAPAAHATDQQIRDGIKSADEAMKPDLQGWADALKTFSQNQDPAPVRSATQKLVADVTNERKLLVAVKASTPKVRRGKSLYLKALKRLKSGFTAFDKALAGIQAGKASSVKAQLKKFERRIEAADAAGKKAEKLIGVS